MKLAFLILLVFAFHISFSQSKIDIDKESFFRIGGKVGVDINKVHGQSFKTGYSYNYLLGAFLQFNFSRRFGLQPEVNLTQSTSYVTDDATDVFDDLFADGRQKNKKLNYLQIPVLLNVNIGPSKRVKLQFGPQAGGIIKQTIDDSLRNNNNLYRKTDWSLLGGIWLQIPFINLGARYELGLSNINRKDQERWTKQGFVLFAGFTF